MIKSSKEIDVLANGLGAQSMRLFLMACNGEIPATVSITADTGWELNRLWSNGKRSKASDYFDDIVAPLAEKHGVIARFVRSRYKDGKHLEPLIAHVRRCALEGLKPNIPMFGSKGGRLRQVCTDKWKIRAIRQDARSWFGATSMICAQGIHYGEADRRLRGRFLGIQGKWSIYQTTVKTKAGEKDIKWLKHYYPLVDLRENRTDCQKHVIAFGIPYLISSECDGCPHMNLARWERLPESAVKELSELEALFNGELFFTSNRIPLLESIALMQSQRKTNPNTHKQESDFGCTNAICGV